jgi:hypothetical protein
MCSLKNKHFQKNFLVKIHFVGKSTFFCLEKKKIAEVIFLNFFFSNIDIFDVLKTKHQKKNFKNFFPLQKSKFSRTKKK